MALIDRINMEYGHLMEPDLRLRGLPDPSRLPPMTPAPGIEPPVDASANTSYLAQLMRAMQAQPSFLERITSGLPVPNTPIVHGKQAGSRLFLRGLVGGLNRAGETKAAGRKGEVDRLKMMMSMEGGGGAASGADGGRSPSDVDQARAEYWRARTAQVGEPETDPYFDVKSDAWKALAEQRRASARRSDRAPVGRSSGGSRSSGGGGKLTYSTERAALNAKYQSEIKRIKGALANYYDPATPEYDAAVQRKVAEVSAGYQQRLRELNERYGVEIGDNAPPIPAPRPAPATAADDAARRFIERNR